MDALKFLEERKRMCESFGSECTECPANNSIYICRLGVVMGAEAVEQVKLVEEWSAAHPCKTRQSVFLEQWPEAEIDVNGVMQLCPMPISAAHRDVNGECKNPAKLCKDCRREFWMQEVE